MFWQKSRICEALYDKKFLIMRVVDWGALTAILGHLDMKKGIIITLCGAFCAITLAHAATLEVDKERSRIQVDAKATGHTFAGDLGKYTIKAEGDAASHKPSALDLAWDFNDLKTGDEKRDKEMVKWLGGGKPQGSFKFVKSWDEKPEGGMAMGTLTINGFSKSVSFPYTVKTEGEWVRLDGKVSMDYQDFKLPIIRAMAVMTVDPKLVIRFHVVGKTR
jgi:polyisoprenoid-binding protein YceI